MIYSFLTGKQDQDNYIKAFSSAIGSKIVQTGHYVQVQPGVKGMDEKVRMKKKLPGCTAVIFGGLLRGNYHILKYAVENRIDFYYIDHSYFKPGYRFPNWMRVTKNGFVQNCILEEVNEERYFKNFDLEIQDYNFSNKENIVVLPPSNTVGRVFNATNWESNIVDNISKHTDRPIVVRKKTGPVMDKNMIKSVSKETVHYEESIDQVLNNAYCVVAFNSSLALEALRRGIPVICEKYCPAFPLSNSIHDIENLKEKERLTLFKSLSWGQFSFNEIKNVKTFNHLNNIKQWKGSVL